MSDATNDDVVRLSALEIDDLRVLLSDVEDAENAPIDDETPHFTLVRDTRQRLFAWVQKNGKRLVLAYESLLKEPRLPCGHALAFSDPDVDGGMCQLCWSIELWKDRDEPKEPRVRESFEEAWAWLERNRGYVYGHDALEQVRLGWDMRAERERAMASFEEALRVEMLREQKGFVDQIKRWEHVLDVLSKACELSDLTGGVIDANALDGVDVPYALLHVLFRRLVTASEHLFTAERERDRAIGDARNLRIEMQRMAKTHAEELAAGLAAGLAAKSTDVGDARTSVGDNSAIHGNPVCKHCLRELGPPYWPSSSTCPVAQDGAHVPVASIGTLKSQEPDAPCPFCKVAIGEHGAHSPQRRFSMDCEGEHWDCWRADHENTLIGCFQRDKQTGRVRKVVG